MDSELEALREKFAITKDPYVEFLYRRLLLDRGLFKEAGLRVGDIVEVYESPDREAWIENQPWIGEIREIFHKNHRNFEAIQGILNFNRLPDPNGPLYAEEDSRLSVIPIQEANTTMLGYHWGLQHISPRTTDLAINVEEVRLKELYNPNAKDRRPEVVRCPHCNFRIIGVYAYKNGRSVCPSCIKPI